MSKQKITIDSSLLEKVAAYIDAANSKVEKLSTIEEEYSSFAKQAADLMADTGLIAPDDAETVAKQLVDGGISKLGEAFEFAISQTKKQASAIMGVPSDEPSQPEVLTADDAWEIRLGLK